jgi:hypothetical protein
MAWGSRLLNSTSRRTKVGWWRNGFNVSTMCLLLHLQTTFIAHAVSDLKSRTLLAHSSLATGRSIAASKGSGLIGRKCAAANLAC